MVDPRETRSVLDQTTAVEPGRSPTVPVNASAYAVAHGCGRAGGVHVGATPAQSLQPSAASV